MAVRVSSGGLDALPPDSGRREAQGNPTITGLPFRHAWLSSCWKTDGLPSSSLCFSRWCLSCRSSFSLSLSFSFLSLSLLSSQGGYNGLTFHTFSSRLERLKSELWLPNVCTGRGVGGLDWLQPGCLFSESRLFSCHPCELSAVKCILNGVQLRNALPVWWMIVLSGPYRLQCIPTSDECGGGHSTFCDGVFDYFPCKALW